MSERAQHRIILVREWDSQMTGSGCCGRLGGQNHELGDTETFAANRREMEAMGAVYRALREELSDEDVEISVVDPRNAIWLVPAVLRDARRRGFSAREVWDQVRRAVSYNAVIFDGRTLFHGRVPTPEEAVAAIRGELEGMQVAYVS
ncbi:MAG TPA: hypothetical protein VK869_06120 [Rubrobacteraceae bacterium]|nr:hypothetical protein [Rubrobacteraceae bacterium]